MSKAPRPTDDAAFCDWCSARMLVKEIKEARKRLGFRVGQRTHLTMHDVSDRATWLLLRDYAGLFEDEGAWIDSVSWSADVPDGAKTGEVTYHFFPMYSLPSTARTVRFSLTASNDKAGA